MKQNLTALAVEHVVLGLRMLAIYPCYEESLQPFRPSILAAVSELLEALSGVLCELSIQQKGEEPECDYFDDEAYRNADAYTKADRYLHACSVLLDAYGEWCNRTKPFTVFYLGAQTVSFEVRELAEELSKDNDATA